MRFGRTIASVAMTLLVVACAHDHPAPSSSGYGPDYTACVQDPAMQKQTVNDRDYSFFVPAPPKPTASAVLTYRVVDMLCGSEPPETITPQANGINVTLKFAGSSASALRSYSTATRPRPSTPCAAGWGSPPLSQTQPSRERERAAAWPRGTPAP